MKRLTQLKRTLSLRNFRPTVATTKIRYLCLSLNMAIIKFPIRHHQQLC
ncbi:hypothetical protein [Calothrix sp. NIES-3974]|nr:hypothetical protein [Calothrix sp. NIES-3974]